MEKICPKCNHPNHLDLELAIEQYVCSNCKALIDAAENKFIKEISSCKYFTSLKIGQKGTIEKTEYTVVAIVIRKTGSGYQWAEYYLKDKHLNDAFLSESEGHWVFMKPLAQTFQTTKYSATYNDETYRKYEITQCSIASAQGFFEDSIKYGVASYSEYVRGNKMISYEHHGENSKYYLEGRHFPNSELKKAFKTFDFLPSKNGYGIVQPFFINTKQLINIFGVAAIIISLLQFYFYITRSNYEVYRDSIRFDAVRDKELISKSFELKGASAPLEVKLYSNVNNSWANIELSLVNEKNNETEYASKDIEQYHGYEDGESWSEGSTNENFSICGVNPSKYHFAISAQKQGFEKTSGDTYFSPDGTKSYMIDNLGFVDITIIATQDKISYNLENIENNNPLIDKELKEAKAYTKNNPNILIVDNDTTNPTVDIVATWKPVTLWNYFIILAIMILFIILCFWGEYVFEKEKWSNSANTPYPETNN
jgi:hypothetical protein